MTIRAAASAAVEVASIPCTDVTTPTLRPYQLQAVAEIRQAYQQRHRSVLFVLPTSDAVSQPQHNESTLQD
jgi:superfamily II DNA or RNA helicase